MMPISNADGSGGPVDVRRALAVQALALRWAREQRERVAFPIREAQAQARAVLRASEQRAREADRAARLQLQRERAAAQDTAHADRVQLQLARLDLAEAREQRARADAAERRAAQASEAALNRAFRERIARLAADSRERCARLKRGEALEREAARDEREAARRGRRGLAAARSVGELVLAAALALPLVALTVAQQLASALLGRPRRRR